MANGLIWATAEDIAKNRGMVLSLYRQILRRLNSPDLPLNLAARLAKKAEVRAIFMVGSEERSLHNIEDLVDTAEYALSVLRKGYFYIFRGGGTVYSDWATCSSCFAKCC